MAQPNYGSIESSHIGGRSVGFNVRRISLLLVFTCVGISALVLYQFNPSRIDLIDKQQASWGVVPAYDWDQGWMHRFTHSSSRKQEKFSSLSLSKPSIQKVDELMTEAVGMLKELKEEEAAAKLSPSKVHLSKLGDQNASQPTSVPATAAAPASGVYVPNKYDLERQAKYAEQQGLSKSLPACFKINKFDDLAKNEAQRRMSEATAQLGKAYPDWAKGLSIPGVGQTGEWRHDR